MDDYTGRQIGHYRILRQLGSGAFATVYLAEHLYIERLAAIKILHVTIDAQSYRQFQEEARINARLEHPHIVRLLDFGFYQQMPYLVMEYAPNGTLRQLYPKKSFMPPQQIINYVPQIAEALDYAHQQNVIHRDVKPENLLLNSRNELILSDFGIALVQQTQQSSSAQEIAGTPLYMAPEQFRGTSLPASDQYALGVIVYEWLCGEPPFSGNAYALSYQHVEQLPRPLSIHVQGISPAIDNVVLRALAKNPAQRFSYVQDFAIALQEAIFVTRPSLRSIPIEDQSRKQSTPTHVHLSPASAMPIHRQNTYENRMQAGYQMNQLVTNQPGYIADIPPLPPSGSFPISPASPLSSQQVVQNQNRQSLVRRVRSFWITGVLEQSLQGAALMELDLQEIPDAVANPWKQIVPTSTLSHILEQRKSILRHYNEANADLLILGAPGSGKTTVLLTLARDLLTQAEQNGDHPVPVIFNLSTWSNNQPLAVWLVDELDSKYQVHRKLGQQLVKANLILPLLDGLDEVAIKERTACIEAINHYRREPGSSPLVVCSRSTDYLAQEAQLLLNKAIMIQPLSMQQANNYLVQTGDSVHALRVALQSDTALRELMHTPLLLRMLTLTYYGTQPDVLGFSSSSEQIPHIIERYVERMLARGSDKTSYSPQATKHWLAWLARQLQQHNQKIFHIERMQPDYLEGKPARQRYTRSMVGLIFSVLGIVLLTPPWLSIFVDYHITNNFTLISSLGSLTVLVTALMLGLVNGVLYQRQVKVSGTSARQKWRRGGQRFVRGIVNILLISLFFGVPFNYILRYLPIDVAKLQMSISLVADIASVFVSVESGVLLFLADLLLDIQTTEIRSAEIIAWSWGKFWRTFFKFLGIGCLCSLLLALLLFGISFIAASFLAGSPSHIIPNNQTTLAILFIVITLLLLLFSFTPLFALLKGLTNGLSTSILDPRDIAIPNQGIRRSARNSLQVGLGGLFFLIGIPALVAVLSKENFLPSLLGYTPLIMLIVLIMALRAGGTACLQHFVLRWLLWRKGAIPWNYPLFLDYAAEHILLQKVGGGYMFVHRFLLEYFASLETPPSQE